MLRIIKKALWGKGEAEADQEKFEELCKHSVQVLPADIISSLSVSPELQAEWKKSILTNMLFYEKYIYIQSNLPLTVPYVILKGTAAAKYYPHPEYRIMGDIDIITRHEDFEKAYQEFVADGYKIDKVLNREIGFVKNGVMVELHQYFASLNDTKKAEYMDDLIISNINPTHELPDLINGIVLLEHISQHLENGLGLRQVIDWMMFVDKCLPDERWQEFRVMAEKIGMETLAIVTTRMCEIYLGLETRKWCAEADELLCKELMDYVIKSGNFGNKRAEDEKGEVILTYARTPKAVFKMLQERGLENWKAVRKYKYLRPFAWIYQSFRYLYRGLMRDNAAAKFKSDHGVAKRRQVLFDKLGASRAYRGLAFYKDGKYKRK